MVIVTLVILPLMLAFTVGAYACTCGKGPSDPRLEEADELVRERRLIGLDREALHERIGAPTKGAIIAGWDEAYYLGRDDACVDSRWLVINYDAEGRVGWTDVTND